PARLGPSTEPTVAAHTTSDRARARCAGAARSVAAKRAASPAALPAPMSVIPSSSRGVDPTTVATVAASAPRLASPYPPTRERRRPWRAATCAIGRAASAEPTTTHVWEKPPTASLPDSSAATREFTAAPVAVPTPTSTWRSEEHTSELQSRENLVCRLLLEKKEIRHES